MSDHNAYLSLLRAVERLESRIENIAIHLRVVAAYQRFTMGQLEDIRDEFAAALSGINAKLTTMAAKIDEEAAALAAALAAGTAPDPATVASLKSLADQARDLAATAAPAPAPSPAPAPEAPPAA